MRPARAAAGPVNPVAAGEAVGIGAGCVRDGTSINCSLINSFNLTSTQQNQFTLVQKNVHRP